MTLGREEASSSEEGGVVWVAAGFAFREEPEGEPGALGRRRSFLELEKVLFREREGELPGEVSLDLSETDFLGRILELREGERRGSSGYREEEKLRENRGRRGVFPGMFLIHLYYFSCYSLSSVDCWVLFSYLCVDIIWLLLLISKHPLGLIWLYIHLLFLRLC